MGVPIVSASTTRQASSTEEMISFYAQKYDVSEKRLHDTLMCESGLKSIQSRIPDSTGPNGQEDSWGVAQIHLPDHLDINKEQAMNPEFAIDWSAKMFSLGKQRMWTCYRNLYL